MTTASIPIKPPKAKIPTTTVGRGKAVTVTTSPTEACWANESVQLQFGDSLALYHTWDAPTVIVSDGAYGVLGFEGDTTDHSDLPQWYEPHIQAWSAAALPSTTLWLWNSEIGWAVLHPLLERHGWRYIAANVWDKGKAHIAGNVNTGRIRQFPVVTELCVQYTFEPKVGEMSLKAWLLHEWKRTGLPLRAANAACGVKDAATRKYFNQGHLWYFPPPDKFEQLTAYANEHGNLAGRPYFSFDGKTVVTGAAWARMRAKFQCPHGVTNVWQRGPLHSKERVRAPNGRAVHLNQKPLDLLERIILASSDEGDVVWEPFGGLFSGALAAQALRRRAFAAEVDATYYHYGTARFTSPGHQRLPLKD